MPVIQPHDVTLYGGTDQYDIALRPLTDGHLPHLYKWMADPEVTYFTESAVDLKYDEATVRRKYGGMSRCALCFAIEANGAMVGECWLQRMNRADVIAMYPEGTDVRRIDFCIGEKEYWNRGIGTAMVGMLVDYAFAGERVDVLHCFCEDYNPRSERMWQKHGFRLVKKEAEEYNPKWRSPIGKWQLHYALTRAEHVERRRVRVPREQVFYLPLGALQPSQLHISAGKLFLAREWFTGDPADMDPIPVKQFMGRLLMTDGHTRAAMLRLAGFPEAPCYWDDDPLDMAAYAQDIAYCMEEGVRSALDLVGRIVPAKDYEVLWRKRCMDMYGEPMRRFLLEGDEAIFWTDRPVPEGDYDIRALSEGDPAVFDRHLALCGRNPLTDDTWRAIRASGAEYFFLFADGEPVARACAEIIGGALREVGDVRVARAHRGKGFGTAVSAHVLNLILSRGHVALCRTLPDNAAMNAVIRRLGFERLYGEEKRI